MQRRLSFLARGACRLALFAALTGCGTSVHLALDVDEDELAFVATFDDSGQLLYAAKLDGSALTIAAPTDAWLAVWRIRSEALVGPDGRALSRDALAAITIAELGTGGPGEGGACQRCLVPSDAAPQMLHAGDSCPIPSFADAAVYRIGSELVEEAVSPELLDLVRRRVRLAVAGDCACEAQIPEGASTNDLEVCAVVPGDSRWLFDHRSHAIDEAGWFAAFQTRGAVIVAPDGRRFEGDLPEPFQGPANGAVPLATSSVAEGGRFLVFSKRLQKNVRDARADLFEVVDGALRRTVSVIDPAELISVQSVDVLEPGRLALLSGDVEVGIDTEPAMAELRIAMDQFTLARQPVRMGDCRYPPSITSMRAATVTSSGTGAAISYGNRGTDDPGDVFIRLPRSEEWRCVPRFPKTYEVSGETGTMTELVEIDTVADRAVFTARGRRANASELLVFSLEVGQLRTPSDVDGWAPVVDADTYRTNRGMRTLSLVPGALPILRTVIEDSQVMDLFGGQILWRSDVSALTGFSDVKHKPWGYYSSRSGWEVFWGASGEAYYRRPPGGDAVRIYGPEGTLSGERVYVAEGFGDIPIAVFQRNKSPSLIREMPGIDDCRRFGSEDVALEPPVTETLLSATHLGAGRYLLIGRERADPLTLFLRWVNLASPSIEGELRLPDLGRSDVTAAALLNEDTFLFADKQGRIFVLRSPAQAEGRTADEVEACPIVWDDPTTSEVETAPPTIDGDNYGGWRRLSVSHGIAWAGGRDMLARIIPGVGTDAPRVEGYWRQRAEAGAFGEYPSADGRVPFVFGLSALCPDRVSAGTDWDFKNLTGAGVYAVAAWRILPERECGTGESEDLTVCTHAIYKAGSTRVGAAGGGVTGVYATRLGLYQLTYNGYLLSSAGYYPLSYGALAESHIDRTGRLWFMQDNNERAGVVVPR